jgi:hypothetical protein
MLDTASQTSFIKDADIKDAENPVTPPWAEN